MKMIETDKSMITPEQIREHLLDGTSVRTFDEVRMCSAYVTTFTPLQVGYQVEVFFGKIKMSTQTKTVERAFEYADQFRKAIDDTIDKLGFPHLRD